MIVLGDEITAGHTTARELTRRIGFAIGQIEEVMGFLEDARRTDARYWAIKAAIRAKDMLLNGRI